MFSVLKMVLCTALIAAPAYAAGKSQPITYHTTHYRCDGGKRIDVSYVTYGQRGTNFAVLNYTGREYGLAQATSASGARYASLTGPVTAQGIGTGLEWWEWHGQGQLSTFAGQRTDKTRKLLSGCKPWR